MKGEAEVKGKLDFVIVNPFTSMKFSFLIPCIALLHGSVYPNQLDFCCFYELLRKSTLDFIALV